MWLHKKVSVGNEMTTQGIECANVFPTRVAIRYRIGPFTTSITYNELVFCELSDSL